MKVCLNFWNGDGGGERFTMVLDVMQYEHLREYLQSEKPIIHFDEEYFLRKSDDTPPCHYEMIESDFEKELVYIINLARV